MAIFNMHEAKTQLSRLVERAKAGEEIVIAQNGKPAVKLVKADPEPLGPRPLGSLRGKVDIEIPDDFDEEDEEIIKLFYEGGPDDPLNQQP
jgi:prevent-host-death family protein